MGEKGRKRTAEDSELILPAGGDVPRVLLRAVEEGAGAPAAPMGALNVVSEKARYWRPAGNRCS